MLEAARDVLLKFLGALLPKLLGWFYKQERIANDIKIRPNGEGDAITVIAGELPNIQIWLLATNLSPFTIEIDRLLVQVQHGAVIGEFCSVRKTQLKPATEALLKVESALSAHQTVGFFKYHTQSSYSMLYITAYINCGVHNLQIVRNVQVANTRMLGVPSAA